MEKLIPVKNLRNYSSSIIIDNSKYVFNANEIQYFPESVANKLAGNPGFFEIIKDNTNFENQIINNIIESDPSQTNDRNNLLSFLNPETFFDKIDIITTSDKIPNIKFLENIKKIIIHQSEKLITKKYDNCEIYNLYNKELNIGWGLNYGVKISENNILVLIINSEIFNADLDSMLIKKSIENCLFDYVDCVNIDNNIIVIKRKSFLEIGGFDEKIDDMQSSFSCLETKIKKFNLRYYIENKSNYINKNNADLNINNFYNFYNLNFIKEHINNQKIGNIKKYGKINLSDCTFIIPIRITLEDRLEILDIIIDYLQHNLITNIMIAEEDIEPKIKDRYENIQYLFIKSENSYFYRTHILNEMIKKSKTDFVVNCDGDLFLDVNSYADSVKILRKNDADIVYPYTSSHHYNIKSKQYTKDIMNNLDLINNINPNIEKFSHGERGVVGGILFANREQYVNSGMENENFVSWGAEDLERLNRFDKLGLRIKRLNYDLLHIDHLRNENSNNTNPYWQRNRDEYEKVKNMTKEQLEEYIKTWEWLK